MLSDSAIMHIEQNAAANGAQTTIREILTKANEGQPFIDGVLLPTGYALNSVEKFLDNPVRFRANFKTDSSSDFVIYVNDNANEHTGIYINKKTMVAVAIIDQGSQEKPKWGDHKATLSLDKQPEYAELLSSNKQKMKQLDFINFVRDNAEFIRFYEEAEGELFKIEFSDGLRRLRKLTLSGYNKLIQEQGDLSANMSANSGFQISSGEEKQVSGFTFETIGYDGLPTEQIDCAIRFDASGNELFISYRITSENQLKEKFAKNFKENLIDSIKVEGMACDPIIGSIDYQ